MVCKAEENPEKSIFDRITSIRIGEQLKIWVDYENS